MADDLNGIDKIVEELKKKIKETKNTEYSADTFVNKRIVINTISDLEKIIKQGNISDNDYHYKIDERR